MTSIRGLRQVALAGGLISFSASSQLLAQRPDSVTLTLRAIDSAGAAVRTADVIVSIRGGAPVARGQTDSAGRARLRIARGTAPLELLVRHIGFQPYSRDFALPSEPTDTINVVLADLAQALDTVVVNARESVRRRNYYIDSTTIKNSGRLIFDGWDLLRKLRPRIAYGLWEICPGVQEVWVNGRWIPPETVLISDMVLAREPTGSSRVTPHLVKKDKDIPTTLYRPAAMSALAMIRPEHIAELTFKDCFDYAIKGSHSVNAVFVVLKPGIGFDPLRGSYVAKRGKPD